MTAPKKYTKKPVEIEAMQFVGSSMDAIDVVQWFKENNYPWLVGEALDPDSLRIRGEKGRPTRGIWINPDGGDFMIRTLEGDMKVTRGDYIIKGVKGEFYPCKPDIFEQTYESVDEAWDKTFAYNKAIVANTRSAIK